MCLSKYLSLLVWAYTELCRALRQHVRRHSYLNLNLNLNLWPYPVPNHALFEKRFQKSFQKPVASSFDLSIGFK